MTLGLFGVSFLTPRGALFALAAAVPLGALLLTERRSRRVRAVLDVPGPRGRALVPFVAALVLLPGLVGVAAAQPVVVRERAVRERGDAQAFFVIDTSRSMLASAARGRPTRLARAKRLARQLRNALADVPIGLAGMTDRTLPYLMPTTDPSLFDRTLAQSVGIDQPPPSQPYGLGRATNLGALVTLATSHFYSTTAVHRLLVVFTDGEAQKLTPLLFIQLDHELTPIFIHVWHSGEEIYNRAGEPDPHYHADPASAATLDEAARMTHGSTFGEHELGAIETQARRILGGRRTTARVDAYARIALAPWIALAGVLPLGFLLWRRNL